MNHAKPNDPTTHSRKQNEDSVSHPDDCTGLAMKKKTSVTLIQISYYRTSSRVQPILSAAQEKYMH